MIDQEESLRSSRRGRKSSIAILVAMGILFCYGLVRFLDAPLRPCAEHGYCGKQGEPHTLKEYKEFEVWQTTLFVVWPIGMLSLYFLNQGKFRQRRRKL